MVVEHTLGGKIHAENRLDRRPQPTGNRPGPSPEAMRYIPALHRTRQCGLLPVAPRSSLLAAGVAAGPVSFIVSGVVMGFERSSADRPWEARVVIRDAPASMTIYDACPSSEVEALARSVVAKIEDAWPNIRANLLRTVHPLYNDTWADPDQGFEPLSTEDFLQRIRLDLVDVMDEEGALSLYFDDAGLFGGHTVDLFWTADGKMHDATLVG